MRPQAGNVGPGPAGDRGGRIEGTRQARPRGRPPPALAGCRAHRCQDKIFRPSGIPAADAPRHESLVTCTAEGLQGEAGRGPDSHAPGRAAPPRSSRGAARPPTHPVCARPGRPWPHGGAGGRRAPRSAESGEQREPRVLGLPHPDPPAPRARGPRVAPASGSRQGVNFCSALLLETC